MSEREGRLTRPQKRVRMSAGREAALYIKRLIFDGELPPGSRVPQGEVAEALGISRIPIREAIIALEREGVVSIVPHRGAYVTGFDADAVLDHYELFGLVYGFAAQRTAERAGPDALAELTTAQKALAATDEPAEFLPLALRFNEVILDLGGSPRLRALLDSLTGIVPGNFFAELPGSVEVQQKRTAQIVDAVERGDGQEAFQVCRSMMREHGQRVLEYFERRGLFSSTGETATGRGARRDRSAG